MTYSPPVPQQPMPAPAPAKKPFYKRAWFIVLAVIAVIAIVAPKGGDSSGDSSTSGDAATTGGSAPADGSAAPADEPATSGESAADEASVGIGQPALDGDFQFVVNGVDCSQTSIGSEYLNEQAQGQFCIVDLAVTNIGSEAQSFLGDNAKLFNAEGQEFSADTEAAFYLPESSSLYEEINPGNTLASKVVFDVPAGMVPSSIELHDSMFSGGVTVALG
ncbi:protein of unknown function [Geodermatophilus saharensis]|uniref:DUF4352 domain-containing protein n=1 Tax=Geodermatophilus saharensis TaxID=1137994 RepID=A0A239EEU4_9ACTN|nr:DUF4352 domain-containing protein [Geodermatophilus saharensis]SNS42412.1 protein of unknown function [Geodermatophilus saharensis]